MNQITTIQNSQEQLERLAAQRELYSSAKKLFNLQLFGNLLVPISISLVAAFVGNFSVYTALYGIIFFIIDTILIEPVIKNRKAKAAKIQELFDSDVLEISKSPFKTSDDITVEEVLTHYNAHKKIESNIEKIRDWFNVDLSELDISIARLICQRVNYSWDCRLRTSYGKILKNIIVILPIIIFIVGIFVHLNLEQVTLILSGLLPVFRFLTKQYQENKDSSEKLGKLNNFFNKTWERILRNEVSKDELNEAARKIQDEIYDNRVRSPLIPDSYYWIYRPNDESLMAKTAETLVLEYKDSTLNRLSE